MSLDVGSWNMRFYGLAKQIATWSKDPSTKVGAVVVDGTRRIIATGYNGFPRDVTDDAVRYELKATKYKLIVHAEANAILNAVSSVKGCTIITTKYPCSDCAKLIIQSGIRDVWSPLPSTNPPWAEDSEWSKLMLKEACVLFREIEIPND